jgi:hypothetical protein
MSKIIIDACWLGKRSFETFEQGNERVKVKGDLKFEEIAMKHGIFNENSDTMSRITFVLV